jgi:phage anti-repressor protein
MEEFIKKHTTLPEIFIKDFFIISKEEYDEKERIIDFDLVVKWLDVTKGNLKRLLDDNFEKEFDYSIEKKHIKRKSTGATTVNVIYITPNCFRELCMLSQSTKAKLVRKYFIEMENIVKRYHANIKLEMEKTIGLLEANQKPKVISNGGEIYILKALNTNTTLYKLGKTADLKHRLNTYNSGNANEIEPLFRLKVSNIQAVEDCVKGLCKKYQYRKYKEVYKIDFNILKKIMKKCSNVYNQFLHEYKQDKDDFKNKISRAKSPSELYLYISHNLDETNIINNN